MKTPVKVSGAYENKARNFPQALQSARFAQSAREEKA
jgi:hypothetical protein